LAVRELEVLTRLAHGATTPEIAAEIRASPHAVRHSYRSAMQKLGARTRDHAVAIGIALGLIDTPPPEDF
jgi:DNA-binding CsgD family transcriptional regulator